MAARRRRPPPDPDAPAALQSRSVPSCHPDRRYFAKGMCRECYGLVDRDSMTTLEKKQLNEMTELHRSVEYIEGLARQARAILESRLPAYADLHFHAAEVAALSGDSRPAEWALTHIKAGKEEVVRPPAKTAPEAGVKVFIGVKIDGGQGEIVSAEALPEP
jgi:hypothetical protein